MGLSTQFRLLLEASRQAEQTPGGYARWADLALLMSQRWLATGEAKRAVAGAQEAVRASRLALAENHQDADEVRLGQALLALTATLTADGSVDEARDIVGEAVEISRKHAAKNAGATDATGPRLMLAGALDALAGLVAAQGDVAYALTVAGEAVALYQALADTSGHGPTETLLLARGLNNWAVTAAANGDYERAANELTRAVTLYREAIEAGARGGEALLSRALQALTAIQEERGSAPVPDTAAQGSYAYLAAARHEPQVLAADLGAASAGTFLTGFDLREAESPPQPASEEGPTEEGTGALTTERNTYVELATAIEAVRDALRQTAAAQMTSDLQLQVGPIELELGVELRADAGARAGVRVMVLLGGPDKSSGGAQHRIRLELTPRASGGRDLLIGDDLSDASDSQW
ncbi:trypco2 family protein [Streptomyces sp. NPDC098789]|uniref:trypco2 family protein n=1 Tax=Streptomyces sp. NPDC098789 TaxID=3366098 RepID=UPI00382B3B0A